MSPAPPTPNAMVEIFPERLALSSDELLSAVHEFEPQRDTMSCLSFMAIRPKVEPTPTPTTPIPQATYAAVWLGVGWLAEGEELDACAAGAPALRANATAPAAGASLACGVTAGAFGSISSLRDTVFLSAELRLT